MDGSKGPPDDSAWRRLKRHFTEAFSGELLAPQREEDAREGDEWRERRRNNAFRYILLMLVAILAPLAIQAFYIGAHWLAGGILALLGLLVLNIAMISLGREVPVSPIVTQTLAILLLLLALYQGYVFFAYLLFPTVAGLPVLLRPGWSVGLTAFAVATASALLLTRFGSVAVFVFALSLSSTWLISHWLIFVLNAQASRLKGMAITDPLTGVYNRRYLELRAATAVENWERYRRPVALLLIDIDHFKRINDKFGHAAGDKALCSMVNIMRSQVRKVDTLCRFGGEEFVLLLSEADDGRALEVADKLRRTVENAHVLPEGRMTISIGVCDVAEADNVDHWLKLADAALYLAKTNGRNRVEMAHSEPVAVDSIAKTVPDWR